MKTTRHHEQGFTLIELMITVAIVGILAAIAYPSYTAQVQKSRRADAQVALMEIMQRQESYFLRNRSYAEDLTQLGYAAASPDNHYDLAVATLDSGGGACDGTNADSCASFTATATPTVGDTQVHDAPCQVFTLDNRGVKRGGIDETHAEADTAQTCWK